MKPFKKRQQGTSGLRFGDKDRTVHNNLYEAPFQPNKLIKYYGVIDVNGKSFVIEYEAKYRSEAKAIFEEESRLAGGKLTTIGVYNK